MCVSDYELYFKSEYRVAIRFTIDACFLSKEFWKTFLRLMWDLVRTCMGLSIKSCTDTLFWCVCRLPHTIIVLKIAVSRDNTTTKHV